LTILSTNITLGLGFLSFVAGEDVKRDQEGSVMRGMKSCKDQGKAEQKVKTARQGKSAAGAKKTPPTQQEVRQQAKEWDHVT
jgi:hypothetical protein